MKTVLTVSFVIYFTAKFAFVWDVGGNRVEIVFVRYFKMS